MPACPPPPVPALRRRLAGGLAWLVLLVAPAAAPQSPATVPLGDLVFETWTTRDGLPHNSINAIGQSPEGYLWLATWEGAARFNGREFQTHTGRADGSLPDPGLRTLRVLRDGGLVVGGARGGLARLEDGRWQALPAAPGMVSEVFEDKRGRLWLGTESQGAVLVEPDGSRRVFHLDDGLPGDSVYAFTQTGDGRVWIGTSGGLAVYDNGRLETVRDPALPPVPVTSLAQDPRGGGLLIGTYRGLFLGTPGDQPLVPPHPGLASLGVTRLYLDRAGELWIGTLDRGVFRLGARGLESLGVADGLPNSRVTALFEDREGSVWVGTNGGLVRLGQASFSTLTQARGLAGDYVRTVVEDPDGVLWVGTSNGLSRIAGDRIEVVGAGTVLEGRAVLSLALAPDGGVWVGTLSSGAVLWREGRVAARAGRADGLPADEVRAVLALPGGAAWFGTSDGLVQRGTDGRISAPVQGLPDNFVIALHRDRGGRLWVGTGVGAATITDGKVSVLDLGGKDDAQFVFGFHEPEVDDLMWLATDRGLLRYRPSDGRARLVDPEGRLPVAKPFHVLADDNGDFWMPGNRGVMRLSARAAMAAADGGPLPAFALFDEADGMLNAQGNGGSSPPAAQRADGSLAFATARGLALVHPDRLADSRNLQPAVVIESLSVDGGALAPRPGQVLPAGTRRVAFEYAGLSFVMPGRIRYRTRLEGFDADWVERGGTDSVEYTNLAPGDYSFIVTAANPNGEWEPTGARLDFRIAPHPWQRSGFWALVIIVGMAAVVGGVRLRTRRLVRSELRLRAEVEQRTRELSEQAGRLRSANAEKTELLAELRRQAEGFERQAREDALTGVSNRRGFDEILAREFARAQRTKTTLCLGLLDVDHFKQVNDRHSHQAGDAALKAVAATLLANCREIDYVARFGGEEFAILLPHTAPGDASRVFERIRRAVETLSCEDFAPGLSLTASIGQANADGMAGPAALVAAADAALYRAKQGGRNRVCRFPVDPA